MPLKDRSCHHVKVWWYLMEAFYVNGALAVIPICPAFALLPYAGPQTQLDLCCCWAMLYFCPFPFVATGKRFSSCPSACLIVADSKALHPRHFPHLFPANRIQFCLGIRQRSIIRDFLGVENILILVVVT